MIVEQDLIKRTNAVGMVAAYEQAKVEIAEAYRLLESAEHRLKTSFDDRGGFTVLPSYSYRDNSAEDVLNRVHLSAWAAVFDKVGLRKTLSIAKRDALDQQLMGRGEPLPPLNLANLHATCEQMYERTGEHIAQAVGEVFDWLRPRTGTRRADYVTNEASRYVVGRKIILTGMVAPGWGKRPFQASHWSSKWLTALDNVFHMLDGKGVVKSHYGPLVDAIAATETGTGSTDYFAFKAFKNSNLHLEFLRPELLEKFNALAGGANLAP